jgi:hypothetical protein
VGWVRGTSAALVVAMLALARPVGAVVPLTIDDADAVDWGHYQLNAGWPLQHTASSDLHLLQANPVVGIASHGELGATLGYAWRDGRGATRSMDDVDGITDLAIRTKWELGTHADDRLNLSIAVELDVPTGSAHRGLGTGHVDVGGVFIGTRTWGSTSFDWNVGYLVVDAGGTTIDDDGWLVGQAVRHSLNDRWTAIGEAYGVLPHTDGGEHSGFFDAGLQFRLTEHVLLSVIVGTAVGRDSPEFTSSLAVTIDS